MTTRNAMTKNAMAAVMLSAAALWGSGCGILDSLVDVDAPSRILAEVLETPDNASRLLDGAVGDAECAIGGYVVFMGTFSDELQRAGGGAGWLPLDARNLAESGFAAPQESATCDLAIAFGIPGQYKSLSIARYQADHLIELLGQWGSAVPNAATIHANAAAYSGYSHLLLGESMCSAAFDLGPELQPAQILERAEARFTTALALAGSNAALRNLALVGRSRTRLHRNNLTGAKADAEQVSSGFQQNAEFSTVSARRQNPVVVVHVQNQAITVESPFRAFGDPRVVVQNTGRISGTGIPIWLAQKYLTPSAPIRLASWVEAQLIIAEAELAASNLTAAVDAINRVRTRPGVGLPPFSSSDAVQIRNQLVRERMAEFFLESQRHGDVRRLNLPLNPPPGAPHPDGGTYGSQRCVPLPLVERANNPNLSYRR